MYRQKFFFLLLSHGTLEDVELPKKRGNLWNERFINIPSQSSLLLFFLPFLTRWLSMCSSYGIPLLLLHVTIEGRPHSSARELRGDGLKITPKDGMKEIVEQPKQKEGQDFFQDSQNLYTTSWVSAEKVKFVFLMKNNLFVFVVHVSNLWNHFSAHDKYYVPNNFYHEWGFPLNFFEPRVARKFTLIPLHLLIFTTRVITPSEKKNPSRNRVRKEEELEAVKKWHFSTYSTGVEECVITITRQKPETLFSFIKQIGHMLGMVFTLVL